LLAGKKGPKILPAKGGGAHPFIGQKLGKNIYIAFIGGKGMHAISALDAKPVIPV
jgi:hypothetical protein